VPLVARDSAWSPLVVADATFATLVVRDALFTTLRLGDCIRLGDSDEAMTATITGVSTIDGALTVTITATAMLAGTITGTSTITATLSATGGADQVLEWQTFGRDALEATQPLEMETYA
jgi:hypothetical protein